MPLGKLWPNRRGATRARGVITSELGQTQKSDHATWKSALLPGADMAGRVESRLATPVLSGLSRPSTGLSLGGATSLAQITESLLAVTTACF